MTRPASPLTAGGVPVSTLRQVVALAQRAPSVHNTQPWVWRATPDALELHADRSRQLAVSDPDGRNLTISCGAAVHHARVAAEALGCEVEVQHVPDHDRPDLLASLVLRLTGTPDPAAEPLDVIRRRCTDRRRHRSWPVPDARLEHIAAAAAAAGTHARAVTDDSERFHADAEINRSIRIQDEDVEVRAEQTSWVDHGPSDGVPSSVLPEAADLRPAGPQRFGAGSGGDSSYSVEGTDGLVVLFDHEDDEAAWLRAGEGLSAAWLAATRDGLAVVPLSQVIEVAESREALRSTVLDGFGHPLMVIRVGWQASTTSRLPETPRRALDDVLELA